MTPKQLRTSVFEMYRTKYPYITENREETIKQIDYILTRAKNRRFILDASYFIHFWDQVNNKPILEGQKVNVIIAGLCDMEVFNAKDNVLETIYAEKLAYQMKERKKAKLKEAIKQNIKESDLMKEEFKDLLHTRRVFKRTLAEADGCDYSKYPNQIKEFIKKIDFLTYMDTSYHTSRDKTTIRFIKPSNYVSYGSKDYINLGAFEITYRWEDGLVTVKPFFNNIIVLGNPHPFIAYSGEPCWGEMQAMPNTGCGVTNSVQHLKNLVGLLEGFDGGQPYQNITAFLRRERRGRVRDMSKLARLEPSFALEIINSCGLHGRMLNSTLKEYREM